MGRWNTNLILAWIDSHIIDYPTALNLNYNWSFGSAAGFCLGIQIITGAYLSMTYIGDIELAFVTIEYIMRDIKFGWLIRYIHANGASFFFMAIYCHIFRGLYYGSYKEPRQPLWWSGAIIFLWSMATAFMGYILPWGQMSFWAATVITQMLTIIPKIGKRILIWLWGGWVVGNPTLHRFYSLHFIFPFVLVGLVFIHLGLLHKDGSNNPLGIKTRLSNINFYPYFYVKDLLSFFVMLFVLSIFVFYYPNFLLDPLNYIDADPFDTPPHIVPEWYFLPYYSVLRSVPHKLGGIFAMGAAIGLIFIHPMFDTSNIRSGNFRPIYATTFWFFVTVLGCLAHSGAFNIQPEDHKITHLPEGLEYYANFGRVLSVLYFLCFFLLGISGRAEEFFFNRKTINEKL
uniref:Cytochrome b n=1 Tax=Ishige okamurae TaxID=233772 RepID=A0A4Y5T8W2_9PHAE|nr:apocytochrome b [Ishige okamurae]